MMRHFSRTGLPDALPHMTFPAQQHRQNYQQFLVSLLGRTRDI